MRGSFLARDNKTKPRVLFVSHSAEMAGAERFLFRFLAGHDREKFEPVVVLPSRGPLYEKTVALGYRCHVVGCEWWLWFSETPLDENHYVRFSQGLSERVKELRRIIQEEEVDLVFTNTSVIPDGAIAAAMTDVPHIWSIHEMLGKNPELTPLLRLNTVLPLLFALSDRLVAVSSSVANAMTTLFANDRIEVLHGGVELPELSDLKPNETSPSLCVGFAGKLSLNKGVIKLVDMAAQLTPKFPDLRFLIAGVDAGALALMQTQVREKGLVRNFEFLGWQSDISSLLRRCDVFALPSIADSFPTAVLEAMAMAKPVVATKSGGAREIVVDGETGFLVDVFDDSAFCKALARLLEDQNLRQKLGEGGRRRVETQFSAQQFISRYEDLIVNTHTKKEPPPLCRRDMAMGLLSLLEEMGMEKEKTTRLCVVENRIQEIDHQLLRLEKRIGQTEAFLTRVRSTLLYRLYRFIKRNFFSFAFSRKNYESP